MSIYEAVIVTILLPFFAWRVQVVAEACWQNWKKGRGR